MAHSCTPARVALFASLAACVAAPCAADERARTAIASHLEPLVPRLEQVSAALWDYAELGFLETRSSALLATELRKAGFTIEEGVAGMPTAFVATYGSGAPVIGLLAEMDALPGLSQAAAPVARPIEGKTSAHACGHNLFAAGSLGAALAVSRWLAANAVTGTVKLFATPAEEGGAGKVYMTRAGLFAGVDVVLHWHPASLNAAAPVRNNAVLSAKFRFRGKASHAASTPERGRSALDGVEAMNYMVNMLREHARSSARIHYVITQGGAAPNVVPDFAESYYYLRESDIAELRALWERVQAAAAGAAQGTGTTVSHEIVHGTYNLLPNESLQKLLDGHLRREADGLRWSDQEREFARALYDSLDDPEMPLDSERNVAPFAEVFLPGSSDVGDVSWVVPTAGLVTTTWVPGTDAHTWQAAAVGRTGVGYKGMVLAARVLAASAADLFLDTDLLSAARTELEQRRGKEFEYQALIGDRPPPLDYRK